MLNNILLGAAVTVGVPLLLTGFLFAVDKLLDRVRSKQTVKRLRTIAWLLPGGLVMAVVLAYPVLSTLRMSVGDRSGEGFTGLENYAWAFTDPSQLAVLGRTLLWVIVVPLITVGLAVVFSALADRTKYEKIARLAIVLPCAISMTAGAVIWSLIYLYDPPGVEQRGVLNAAWTSITGADPIPWLIDTDTTNAALMMIGLWAWLGFAGLLVSAAIKGVLPEYIDAAKVDGANEWRIFWHITLPQIVPMLVVVATLVVSWALKVFDIIYVLTGGQYGTSVLGVSIHHELFITQDLGRGSALSIILMLLALPIGILNIWRNKKEEMA